MKSHKIITYDKNYIVSTKLINQVSTDCSVVLTETLLLECLGDLVEVNARINSTKEDYTASHFRKIQALTPAGLFPNFSRLICSELMGEKVRMKHDLFGFGVEVEEGGILLENSRQIEEWAKGHFTEEDYETARVYRKGRKAKQEELKKSIFTVGLELKNLILQCKENFVSDFKLRGIFERYLNYYVKISSDIIYSQKIPADDKIFKKMSFSKLLVLILKTKLLLRANFKSDKIHVS